MFRRFRHSARTLAGAPGGTLGGTLAGTLGLASLVVLAACQDTSVQPTALDAPDGPHASPRLVPAVAAGNQDLAALRKATARYHDVEVALADGYLPDPHCVAAPPGGMGMHYVNPGNMDLVIDPSRPEALLYEPTADGVRLVGAEFLVHGDGWDALHTDPPRFAGVEFDPPMDRGAAAPPGPFYTLHVWIWKHNPSGMFAPFNPRVSCPAP